MGSLRYSFVLIFIRKYPKLSSVSSSTRMAILLKLYAPMKSLSSINSFPCRLFGSSYSRFSKSKIVGFTRSMVVSSRSRNKIFGVVLMIGRAWFLST